MDSTNIIDMDYFSADTGPEPGVRVIHLFQHYPGACRVDTPQPVDNLLVWKFIKQWFILLVGVYITLF